MSRKQKELRGLKGLLGSGLMIWSLVPDLSLKLRSPYGTYFAMIAPLVFRHASH